MRSKKAQNAAPAGAVTAVKAPRLVKAAELVAREMLKAVPRVPSPAPRPVRVPRGATEARALFNTLFGEAAKVS